MPQTEVHACLSLIINIMSSDMFVLKKETYQEYSGFMQARIIMIHQTMPAI